MTRSTIVVAFACLTFAHIVFGQADDRGAPQAPPPSAPNARPAPYDAMLNKAFALLTQGRVDEMLDELGYVSPNVAQDAHEAARKRLIAIGANAGRCEGFDVFGAKPVTDRFQQVFAFAYYEKRPVLLVFQLYKANGRWRAHDILITSELDRFLDPLPMEMR